MLPGRASSSAKTPIESRDGHARLVDAVEVVCEISKREIAIVAGHCYYYSIAQKSVRA
jgi:hypothetical protein